MEESRKLLINKRFTRHAHNLQLGQHRQLMVRSLNDKVEKNGQRNGSTSLSAVLLQLATSACGAAAAHAGSGPAGDLHETDGRRNLGALNVLQRSWRHFRQEALRAERVEFFRVTSLIPMSHYGDL